MNKTYFVILECIFDLGNIIACRRFEVGQFRHHHSGKTRTMALFWLHLQMYNEREIDASHKMAGFMNDLLMFCSKLGRGHNITVKQTALF